MQTSNRRFEILPEIPANNSLSNAVKGWIQQKMSLKNLLKGHAYGGSGITAF